MTGRTLSVIFAVSYFFDSSICYRCRCASQPSPLWPSLLKRYRCSNLEDALVVLKVPFVWGVPPHCVVRESSFTIETSSCVACGQHSWEHRSNHMAIQTSDYLCMCILCFEASELVTCNNNLLWCDKTGWPHNQKCYQDASATRVLVPDTSRRSLLSQVALLYTFILVLPLAWLTLHTLVTWFHLILLN